MTKILYTNSEKVFSNAKKMASRNIFRYFFRANFFMFVLLISNHTVFLVQFEINLHLWVFQKAHSCKLIPNWTRNRMITYTNTNTIRLLWLFCSVYKQKVIVFCWLVSQENSTLSTWQAAREFQRVDQRAREWKRRKTSTNLYHLWATLSTRLKTKTPTFLTGTPSWRIFCKSLWVSHNMSSICLAVPVGKTFFLREWVRLHLGQHMRVCAREHFHHCRKTCTNEKSI